MSTATKKTVPLAALVEDMSVYPRHAVDEAYVGQLVEALRAGAQPPPIVVDAGTMRVVDGWHRARAYRKVLGAEAALDVEFRTYKSEAALRLDAVSLNAMHGRKLDRIDQVRAVLLLEEAGVPEDRIAIALNIRPDRVQTLRVKVAITMVPAKVPPGAVISDANPGRAMVSIPLKRAMLHLAGQELTADQALAHQSQAGTSFLLQVRQIRDALRFDLMNREDERLMVMLVELQDELDRYLEVAA